MLYLQKSRKIQVCVLGVFLMTFVTLEAAKEYFLEIHFGIHFRQESKKGIRKTMQKSMPKKYRIMMPT